MTATARKPAPGLPPGLQNSAPTVSSAPQARRIKKGELLFVEGETSRAMYLLRSGMIRIFKKKGNANIEIDTIHTGQIVGELAFLDGNPRSASGEALTDCELMEISGPAFQAVLVGMPDWLKILLKTVVGRLRTASTRIRQLESSSSAVTYGDKAGKQGFEYIFLSTNDILRICSAVLLVSSRNGSKQEGVEGISIKPTLLQRYINNIMNIPVAKMTSFLDLLTQNGAVYMDETASTISIKDADFIEQFINYMNDENLLEPSKRHDLTVKGFLLMSLVTKHLQKYPAEAATGLSNVNVGEIRKLETALLGREPFRIDDVQELVKLGYATNLTIKSADDAFIPVKADAFSRAYRMQRLVMAIQALNDQKRKAGAGAK